jgi:hypothetical protein
VNTSFLNVTPLTTPGNHIPIGTGAAALDCNASGCHSANGGAAGGFKLGTASINSPTLGISGHISVASVSNCAGCHETGAFIGMVASTAGVIGDSRPPTNASYDTTPHPTAAQAPDCAGCHTTAPTFGGNVTAGSKPPGHIPTTAPCAQCHKNAGNYAQYDSTGTHLGVTGCLICHGPLIYNTFKNVTPLTTPGNHFPIGSLDCNASGCHTTTNVAPGGGGFKIVTSPTLDAAGHTSVTGAAVGCETCHETAPFLGMIASTLSAIGDSRPPTGASYDAAHPTKLAAPNCGNCHVPPPPTFASGLLPTAPKPANHIPTTAVCAQCHTTPGNFAVYSVVGVHQGVTTCNQCHGSGVGPFAGPLPSNTIAIVGIAANHIPIGTADCGNSGCHTTANVSPGGFKIGSASPASPTLNVAGHNSIKAAGINTCAQPCHETAPYLGMVTSTAAAWGDSRPPANATYDKTPHPTAAQGPECSSCHSTTPTFNTNQSGNAKPANHIPTGVPPYSGSAPACATCHTTAGNNALYSVAAVHQNVTACLACHAPSVATTFANVTIVTTPGNHIPINSLDCNSSGCHVTNGGAAGGFKIGGASTASPTLNVADTTASRRPASPPARSRATRLPRTSGW